MNTRALKQWIYFTFTPGLNYHKVRELLKVTIYKVFQGFEAVKRSDLPGRKEVVCRSNRLEFRYKHRAKESRRQNGGEKERGKGNKKQSSKFFINGWLFQNNRRHFEATEKIFTESTATNQRHLYRIPSPSSPQFIPSSINDTKIKLKIPGMFRTGKSDIYKFDDAIDFRDSIRFRR